MLTESGQSSLSNDIEVSDRSISNDIDYTNFSCISVNPEYRKGNCLDIQANIANTYPECIKFTNGEGKVLVGTCQLDQAPRSLNSGMPVHGRWCGPGHPDGESSENNPPPRDPVDRACMYHDLCYQRTYYFSCECDRRLLKGLPGAISMSESDSTAKAAGAGILRYFSQSPCRCKIGESNVPCCKKTKYGVCVKFGVCSSSIFVPGVGGQCP